MPSITPSTSSTIQRIARVPYLNSAPFFEGPTLGERYELTDCVPRLLGERAARGELSAGLMPLADFLRLSDAFERLGSLGIAVRGRVGSVLLFSRKPIRQLEGALIAVTEETSTTAVLLRLILEQRYRLTPGGYHRGFHPDAEALLLIGDEALRFQATNAQYPFEIDLAFEWWLWQHQPAVFAVWAIRKEASAADKKQLELGLARSLALNTARLGAIAKEHAARLSVPAAELEAYLSRFIYRFGKEEEAALVRFRELAEAHDLLSR